ncbi:MAG: hydantoinase B/oxoprolinase family protein [Verrucomicrobiota bacterium]
MTDDKRQNHWNISADTGGTFTDVVATSPEGERKEAKVLSSGTLRLRVVQRLGEGRLRVDSLGLPDGFLGNSLLVGGGIVREFVEDRLTVDGSLNPDSDTVEIDTGLPAPLLGAHLVTQTPLAQPLPPIRMRIATTRGTNALLEGKGAKVILLTSEGFTDLLRIGDQTRPDLFQRPIPSRRRLFAETVGLPVRLNREGSSEAFGTGEGILEELEKYAGEDRVLVLSLCNGYFGSEIEEEWVSKFRHLPWAKVVTASSLSQLPGYLRRTETAVVEGYLGPILDSYLDSIAEVEGVNELKVMTSGGGVLSRDRYRAVDSLLSGPAGGVIGAVGAANRVGVSSFLAFDMGGTSTDVSRYDGNLVYQSELSVGQAKVYSEALRIETVAAGGGSICAFDGHGFTVGPESAGADPGPACYGQGGPLTLTDVHLLLGRLDPSRFGIPLHSEAASIAFVHLLNQANKKQASTKEKEDILRGFLRIADETMAGALRKISIRDGLDPSSFSLISFGGGGGLHACSLAEMLGMKQILQPGSAGILSAEGLADARPERIERRPVLLLVKDFENQASARFAEIEKLILDEWEGGSVETIVWQREVFLRRLGQDATLRCEWTKGVDLQAAFQREFERIFGFQQEDLMIEVATIRVRAVGEEVEQSKEEFSREQLVETQAGDFLSEDDLASGCFGQGPCVISQKFGTLVVEKGWQFMVGEKGSILLDQVEDSHVEPVGFGSTEIRHELFRNRFGGVVESMGEVLRRTALSVNIRERLDFSCALLDAEGRLVVNAPHIPVHLGAMGVCVRSVSQVLNWKPGDIAITNHPGFGGSHLPDVTVMAPVFFQERGLVAFLAVRAHHAEIGGIRPGSMPADARSLGEEGVVIPPFHLFRESKDHRDRLRQLLQGGDGILGSRALETNLADVASQVAAVREGLFLVERMIQSFGIEEIQLYLTRILEQSSSWMLKTITALPVKEKEVIVHLDGGEEIHCSFRVNDQGRLQIDFDGTTAGNGAFQCPLAVSLSSVLYVCRLLVDRPVPLNEGLLAPVDLTVPEGCLLSATFSGEDISAMPPVVAGNVEVSQRLVQALIRLFGIEADSQATMNNVIFGSGNFSHYETLAGGEGASARGPGADAVQVHMTNTAITDAEILEHRFPVKVVNFSIRNGSGGQGRNSGGCGVVREYLFEEEVELSLLTQQRDFGPKGSDGGLNGSPGQQILIHPDGTEETLPFASTVTVPRGSRLRVETPGGGGWGEIEERSEDRLQETEF